MPNKTIYFSEKESSIFSEIEDLAKKENRGTGYKIIEIFKEWKKLKSLDEAGRRVSKRLN